MKPTLLLSGLLILLASGCTTPAPVENRSVHGFDTPTTGNGTGNGVSVGGAGGDSGVVDDLYDCGPAPSVRGTFTKQKLREAAGACAVWEYCRSHGASKVLASELDGEASLAEDATRLAYRKFAQVWAESELFQFGPLPGSAVSTTSTYDPYQGKTLRPPIYSWPQVSRCKTEEQLATKKYETNLDGIVLSGRGLHALDYLVFYEGTDTSCTANSPTGTTFASLTKSELVARKFAYAKALADDEAKRLAALRNLWSPDGDNFTKTWSEASGYPSEQEAMNVLGWALLYAERQVKDWKLGIPAGIVDPLTTPVSELEAPYSGISLLLIEANMKAFDRLYSGCSAPEDLGFDDWLTAAGHADLAKQISDASVAAKAAVAALAKKSSPSTVDFATAQAAVKALTDYLKGDLFGSQSPINLELPAGLEGDTD